MLIKAKQVLWLFCYLCMITWEKILGYCTKGSPAPDQKVLKTQNEWQMILDPEEFRITRLKGTERAFSSEICNKFEPGKYACKCCGELLFDSVSKFDSGTGWPSFGAPAKENALSYHADYSFGMVRVEVCCNSCQGHLGHVFPDGPSPSGLRYCINAIAIRKLEEKTSIS
jgi:methionine-R-sulfoxide reductase